MDEVPPLPDAALTRLPIFPLPNAVLFPGMVLPLHVFEPRYRQMVEAALSEGAALGIALLEPGYEAEYYGRPPVHPVLGAGRIVAHEQLPDGRWNILVHGTDRVRRMRELPPDEPFRRIRTQRLAETGASTATAADLTLRNLVVRLGEAVPQARPQLLQLLENHRQPARLADHVAATTLPDPAARQSVLAELDVGRRLGRVIDELAAIYLRVADGPEGDAIN